MIKNLTNIFENQLLESIDPGRLSTLKKYEGWFGTVYKLEMLGKFYALKIFKPVMHKEVADGNIAAYDYEVLETLNLSSHYPILHAYKEREWMLVEWIDGVPFRTVSNKERYSYDLHNAYHDAVRAGWYPDDVKGDNLVLYQNTLMIIDVGSFLPTHNKVDYSIRERVEFVIRHAHIYPSVRDKPPYDYKEYNWIFS